MARHLRYIPPGCLVEVTCRTIQGRHLLRPGSRFNRLFIGILARAQRRFRMRVCEPACLSNHYHLLLIPDNALQLALFMNYLNSNLAREAGRLHDWNARFWQSRYSAVPVSNEEAAQVERLLYLLAQGCKEGLVSSPLEWPGVNGTRAWLRGIPLRGIWIDRTAAYKSGRRNGESRLSDFELEETLQLSALPCWAHLDSRSYRARYAELVREVEQDASRLAEETGRAPAGADAVTVRDPHFWPNRVKRMPAPWFHAATRTARKSFREAYALFLAAYRRAAESLRAGILDVAFPEGSFPPPRRFVVADVS
jgi:REP element-mobilizing transposase RayT